MDLNIEKVFKKIPGPASKWTFKNIKKFLKNTKQNEVLKEIKALQKEESKESGIFP